MEPSEVVAELVAEETEEVHQVIFSALAAPGPDEAVVRTFARELAMRFPNSNRGIMAHLSRRGQFYQVAGANR